MKPYYSTEVPEHELGNRIVELIVAGDFAAAEALLPSITDPDTLDTTTNILELYREGE
jgi:hypothetical protein